jgi:hypothetical protein
MSSGPMSDDEHLEVDDETLFEVVRRPTRQQAICPRSPMPHRRSRQRTLLAILKRSLPSGKFEQRASWSQTCSDG